MKTVAPDLTDVARQLEELRREIHRRIAPVLRTVGVEDHEVLVTIDGSVADLRITLFGPSDAESAQQALGVRVLDAVHAQLRTYGRIHIAYRDREAVVALVGDEIIRVGRYDRVGTDGVSG